MTEIKILNIEDVEDWFEKFLISFRIDKIKGDYTNVESIGDLLDEIKHEFVKNDEIGCTTQRTFYQIRSILVNNDRSNYDDISPEANLKMLIPRKKRKEVQRIINQKLGINHSILEAPRWISSIVIFMILSSFLMIFFWPLEGLTVFILGIIALKMSTKLGIELKSNTVKEMVNSIAFENYCDMRRDWHTYNYREIEPILLKWLNMDFAYPNEVVTKSTKLR